MSAPTPAAVRCVVNWPESYNKADYDALMADPRREWQLLRDHIRAVVQEMRGLAGYGDTQEGRTETGTARRSRTPIPAGESNAR